MAAGIDLLIIQGTIISAERVAREQACAFANVYHLYSIFYFSLSHKGYPK